VTRLDDLLQADPDARRCLRFLVHGEGTLDDFVACYGGTPGATSADLAAALGQKLDDGDAARSFEEADELSEDDLLAELRRLVDATPTDEERRFEEPPEPGTRTDGLDATEREWYRRLYARRVRARHNANRTRTELAAAIDESLLEALM
jgi:hypothetical protein